MAFSRAKRVTFAAKTLHSARSRNGPDSALKPTHRPGMPYPSDARGLAGVAAAPAKHPRNVGTRTAPESKSCSALDRAGRKSAHEKAHREEEHDDERN